MIQTDLTEGRTTRKALVCAGAAMLLALGSAACGGGGGESGDANPEITTLPAARVPEALQTIEEDAEDAIDMVFAGGWDKVA